MESYHICDRLDSTTSFVSMKASAGAGDCWPPYRMMADRMDAGLHYPLPPGRHEQVPAPTAASRHRRHRHPDAEAWADNDPGVRSN